jgi:hypothetical protein
VIPASVSAERAVVPGGAGAPGAPGAGAAALSASAGRFDRFLLGPSADLFFLGPGATVVIGGLLLVLLRLGGAAQVAGGSLTIAVVLMFVGPHYAATYRRAYSSREILRAHPWVTLAAPVILAAGAVVAVRYPTGVGLAYFALYVGWSGYHYSGQSLGLAMIYPLRQGARLDLREKRLIALPLYLSWILSVVGLFRLASPARNPAYEMVRRAYSGPPVPDWVAVVGLVILAASLWGVARVARARRRRGTPLPWPTYAVLSAQLCWFTVGLYQPFVSITLVPVFHSLQYLGLTSWHTCHGNDSTAGRRFAGYVLVVLALGLVINPGMTRVFSASIPGADALVVGAAVMAFINIHHFLLDGRIWRLRDRRVVQSMVA